MPQEVMGIVSLCREKTGLAFAAPCRRCVILRAALALGRTVSKTCLTRAPKEVRDLAAVVVNEGWKAPRRPGTVYRAP